MRDLRQLYEQDYSAWAEANADLLRARQFDQLDVEHLLEELSDMGKSEERTLESRLRVLLAHLLKWRFQYAQLADCWREFDGRSWRNTIVHQRTELRILLRKYPGMQRLWPTALVGAYADARELAAAETGLPIERSRAARSADGCQTAPSGVTRSRGEPSPGPWTRWRSAGA